MPVDTSSMKNMPAMEEEAASASRRFVGARGGNPRIVRISWWQHWRWQGTRTLVTLSLSPFNWSLTIKKGIWTQLTRKAVDADDCAVRAAPAEDGPAGRGCPRHSSGAPDAGPALPHPDMPAGVQAAGSWQLAARGKSSRRCLSRYSARAASIHLSGEEHAA